MSQKLGYNPAKLSREELHRTYGGLVRLAEFDTEPLVQDMSYSYWASKIVANWNFDKKCRLGVFYV